MGSRSSRDYDGNEDVGQEAVKRLLLLGRITMQSVLCVCVCLLATITSCAKTTEPIQMPFGVDYSRV